MSFHVLENLLTMNCEGCSLRLTILRRKKKCEDCGFTFCSECATSKGRLYQCYRCKVFTCIPFNSNDVASLKLRDLQWFLDSKGIATTSNDRREKPVLVDRVMMYSRLGCVPPESYKPLYPPLQPDETEIGGLFGSNVSPATSNNRSVPATQPNQSDNSSSSSKGAPPSVQSESKHQIIDLESVSSRGHIFELSNMELKVLLTRNFISFRGCCEKTELQEKVCWLWDIKEAAKNKNTIPDENLCKICMESTIDSLFLDCGHMVTCTHCGKLLHDCPICRQIIVRVVRAFKS